AGKTTSAIAAMRYLGAELITNDLLLLKGRTDTGEGAGPPVAMGLPLQVRIATGTIRSMGLLPHLDPYDEVFPFLEPPDWRERERKIEVSARRVASWFGGVPCPSAPVSCFVWPQISGGDRVSIREVPPVDTADWLRAEVTYFDPAWPTWTGIGYHAPSPLPAAGERLIDECGKCQAVELHGSRQVGAAIRELGSHLRLGGE
ncbi:MAG TPA: hypothetical protein VFY14_18445, partial [Streptomyces sp.]|nr:hypothetical protein [Streptomyces sp.]